MQCDHVFGADRRLGMKLEQFAEQQAIRETGQCVGSCKLRHVVPCRMVLDRRAVEVGNGLEAERRDHRDNQRLDQKQFGMQRHAMAFERMERQRGNSRQRCEKQADYADIRADRGARDDTRAKAEYQTDRDEMQQRIMGGDCDHVEKCQQDREGIVSDRVTPFPASEVVETAHRGGAGIGTDGGEAQKGGESAHCGQKEQEGAFELAADKQADADEHDSEPGYGKPHAVQHRHKIAIHR